MPKLTVTFGGEVQGERSVEEPITVVGRDAACQVRIDNLGISRTHCRITKRGEGYVLQDMDSANGTFVNGTRITEHSLNEGDEILVGKYTLKFSLAGIAAPAPKTPTDMIDMGEAMHTYVMDGDKIRERLGQIRAAGGPEAEAEAAATAVPGSQPAATPPAGAQLPPAPGPAAFTPTPMPAPMPSAGPGVPAPPVPRRAMDHALDFDPLKPQTPVRARSSGPTQRLTKPPAGGAAGALLYMSLGTNLILIVLLGVLIAFLWKMMQQQKSTAPAPPPPAATSPAPTPAPAAAPEVEPAEPGPGVPSE